MQPIRDTALLDARLDAIEQLLQGYHEITCSFST
jgi:DNA mismatch repair protein MutS